MTITLDKYGLRIISADYCSVTAYVVDKSLDEEYFTACVTGKLIEFPVFGVGFLGKVVKFETTLGLSMVTIEKVQKGGGE